MIKPSLRLADMRYLKYIFTPAVLSTICAILALMLAWSDPWQGLDHFLTSGLIYFGLMFFVFIVISPLLFPIALAMGVAIGVSEASKSSSN